MHGRLPREAPLLSSSHTHQTPLPLVGGPSVLGPGACRQVWAWGASGCWGGGTCLFCFLGCLPVRKWCVETVVSGPVGPPALLMPALHRLPHS